MRRLLLFAVFMSMFALGNSQISPGVYFSESDDAQFELKISEDYFILTSYESKPANFLQTIGGFYSLEDGEIKVDLEFNSNFENDSVKHIDIPYQDEGGILIFRTDPKLVFKQEKRFDQDLDGYWLFATRGPDTGQDRRGESNARKTLKVLMDGRFQWIAYHTETMKFSGTGGGSYSANDGAYTEKIEYFSRDNSRVGAKLKFDYNLMDDDWHHTGLNSKGEGMYEIWSLRN